MATARWEERPTAEEVLQHHNPLFIIVQQSTAQPHQEHNNSFALRPSLRRRCIASCGAIPPSYYSLRLTKDVKMNNNNNNNKVN